MWSTWGIYLAASEASTGTWAPMWGTRGTYVEHLGHLRVPGHRGTYVGHLAPMGHLLGGTLGT